MYVFDATPLIYLAKASRLDLLAELEGHRVIPRRVYEECVTEGVEAGYPDARNIQRAVKAGTFERRFAPENSMFDRLSANPRLSQADAAVLAIADAHSGVGIMDEAIGREIAATESIRTRGTVFLLLELVSSGHLPPSEAKATFEEIVEAGWYCSTRLYANVLNAIERAGTD